MFVEFHDREIDNIKEGTHSGTAGGRNGIDYPYQVETWVQDLLPEAPLYRAYCVSGGAVLAVWGMAERAICYIGNNGWPGTWQAPSLYEPRNRIAVITLEELGATHANAWAAQALKEAGCAVLLQPDPKHRIRAAWELVDGVATLVARAPGVEVD